VSLAARERYSTVAIVLHWTIALLLLGQIAGGFYMHDLSHAVREAKIENDPRQAQVFQLYQLHKSFGMLILTLSFVRLFWRFGHKPPALPAGMAAWEKVAARGVHVLFYVLMIGTPLLGWAMVSASPFKVPTVLFGLFELPHLPFFVDAGERISGLLEESHELAAKSILVLLGLHVAAALKHHFVNRDQVLAHMAPIFGRRNA
jgi:cytochrome b561